MNETQAQEWLDAYYNLYTVKGDSVWAMDTGDSFLGAHYEIISMRGFIDASERAWMGKDPSNYILVNDATGQAFRYDVWRDTLVSILPPKWYEVACPDEEGADVLADFFEVKGLKHQIEETDKGWIAKVLTNDIVTVMEGFHP